MPRALEPGAARALVLLAAACAVTSCTVWQAGDIEPTYSNDDVHRGAEALAFDAGSTTLVSGGWNGELALWAMDGDRPQRVWRAHDGFVHGVDWVGERIVSAGRDGWIRLWQRDGTPVAETHASAAVTRMRVLGARVVSAHTDGSVRTWRLPGLAAERRFDLHDAAVASLAVAPASGRIASGGFDGRVFVIEPDGAVRALAPPSATMRSLAFADDGRTLFGGGWFRIQRWDLVTGERRSMATPHWGIIAALAMLPDGHTIASISRVNDSSVLFLDTQTGATVRHFRRQSICGGAIGVSADGHYLATTGDDGVVRIWDLDASG